MDIQIEHLYRDIALEVYAAKPTEKWTKATCHFQAITRMSAGTCSFSLENGTEKSVFPGSQFVPKLMLLREKMANFHENKHAWYSTTSTVTSAGKFHFDFDYDHLPPFKIIPSPDKWVDEFNAHPRPELQVKIQDWIDKKVEPAEIVQRLKQLQRDEE